MQPIKVFFCERVGDVLVVETYRCPLDHRTEVERGRVPEAQWNGKGDWDTPIRCGECGADAKLHTRSGRDIFRRSDTGEEIGKAGLPPGAVYEGQRSRQGPDGRALTCVCPDGHHWFIDGRASNCTMKDDDVHRCWVRRGRPEDGTLHVDKNGVTCAAGAGSIDTGQWHGFLHNGELHT